MRAHLFSLVVLGVAAASSFGIAAAQAPSRVGEVGAVTGPEGSVLVVRGSESFTLRTGDALFDNDQVFTRSNGTASLTFPGCSLGLGSASSITVNSGVCTATPIQLAANEVVGGVTIGAGGAGGIGATPAILGALATAGGAAALAGDDGPSSP